MKKIYSFLAAVALTLGSQAQNSIPNGNFESWTSGTYDLPTGFISSNPSTFFRCNTGFNCVKTTDSYHGNFAIKLTTGINTDTCFGYAINAANANGGNPCQWRGGTAFSQIPTGVRGYYKSNVMTGDTAGIVFAFRSGSTCLGTYMLHLYGVHSTYTPFSLTFSPPLSGTPDTMVFAAVSSDVFNKIAINGSMLQLDSISLTGISPQPATFNGDFENWQSVTVNKPNGWYLSSDDQGDGIYQTTDKYAGTYAAELKTYQGDRGNGGSSNHPVAQGAGISTGYYPNHCGGSCTQLGGHPFNHQIDTLCFYYKYAPSGNDTAEVNLNFKHLGLNTWGTGMPLLAAASYQYKELAFNTMNPIDTAIVSFQSSTWRDSALSFVGGIFKVDEVHFKSQPLTTGIKTFDAAIGVKVFPNPSADGNFVVSNVDHFDLVRVYNVYGQEVNATITKRNGAAQVQIDTPGAYFISVNARGKITTQKIIVGKE
jgi:hypothetical protein